MTKPALYILPGETRAHDRVVPAELLRLETYNPAKDATLSKEEKQYRPNAISATVIGEFPAIYPFVLPCEFSIEWANIETAAQVMGLELEIGKPVQNDDPIGRSIIRSWLTTADGSVYTTMRIGDLLMAAKLPIELDRSWIQAQKSNLARDEIRARARPTA